MTIVTKKMLLLKQSNKVYFTSALDILLPRVFNFLNVIFHLNNFNISRLHVLNNSRIIVNCIHQQIEVPGSSPSSGRLQFQAKIFISSSSKELRAQSNQPCHLMTNLLLYLPTKGNRVYHTFKIVMPKVINVMTSENCTKIQNI